VKSKTSDSQRKTKYPIRFVTAASLFDGHDAAINVIRRILQDEGTEVVHLGHNRSVAEIVDTAIQEDVQGIAVSSYQGGHNEFFRYMIDLLKEKEAGHIRVFGGGGGVIVPEEIAALEAYGVTKIYSPQDGSAMGLVGMIQHMRSFCDVSPVVLAGPSSAQNHPVNRLARLITELEEGAPFQGKVPSGIPVIGFTGTGGAGKSSLVDEMVRRFRLTFPDKRLGILCVDPSKRRTGGALLGDRIRMNAVTGTERLGHQGVFMRSLATRNAHLATSAVLPAAIDALKADGFDCIFVETAGIGQSDSEIIDLVNCSIYVMTHEYGAQTQLEKIDMLDLADFVVLNKFEKQGSEDALRDIRHQVRRNRQLFEAPVEDLPVFPTIASQFNDVGTEIFFRVLFQHLNRRLDLQWSLPEPLQQTYPKKNPIIPGNRQRYLAEIADTVRQYKIWVHAQSEIARAMFQLKGSIDYLERRSHERDLHIKVDSEQGTVDFTPPDFTATLTQLKLEFAELTNQLAPDCRKLLEAWPAAVEAYHKEELVTVIRDREVRTSLQTTTLSGLSLPKVALPKYRDWGEILSWILLENLPGAFPFTAGVFPFKREEEDPTRMFAGEGSPERTNHRFHYLSQGQNAKRLSTAFDSVTLYGEDPHERPDIYGKIGNAGVSICTLDDMKKLFSGFDLCAPSTSVSMTINGPAPMMLAFFFNAAIDQQVERYLRQNNHLETVRGQMAAVYQKGGQELPCYHDRPFSLDDPRGFGLGLLGIPGREAVPADTYERIAAETLKTVRGTVQADILKEDQAQNTCIFSTEFALKLMGDIQEYFVEKSVRNYYSVSISGYHIAEAGANPITQAAFTLANGFTYVEYYLNRGLHIDDFAPNLSFFFSNGLDPEYAVIGRVARRIWAVTLKNRYGANLRSQKLKYHIQTSGRSLHAQEIDFNDIRTTLQALVAIYDNCNSLHTNAFDEAITTPTEDSVRRALAIQMIINRELGMAKNQNPLQGSFIIEELTHLLEEAILSEFERLSERGGVLGAMEKMYQRSKIQEESLLYEHQKHSGALPIIGVNTFLKESSPKDPNTLVTLMRSTEEEKRRQILNLQQFQQKNHLQCLRSLTSLREAAHNQENLFEALLRAVPYCSLGQMSLLFYDLGGRYRRNM
jgi:methylmalonyl-CoA mutase